MVLRVAYKKNLYQQSKHREITIFKILLNKILFSENLVLVMK